MGGLGGVGSFALLEVGGVPYGLGVAGGGGLGSQVVDGVGK